MEIKLDKRRGFERTDIFLSTHFEKRGNKLKAIKSRIRWNELVYLTLSYLAISIGSNEVLFAGEQRFWFHFQYSPSRNAGKTGTYERNGCFRWLRGNVTTANHRFDCSFSFKAFKLRIFKDPRNKLRFSFFFLTRKWIFLKLLTFALILEIKLGGDPIALSSILILTIRRIVKWLYIDWMRIFCYRLE